MFSFGFNIKFSLNFKTVWYMGNIKYIVKYLQFMTFWNMGWNSTDINRKYDCDWWNNKMCLTILMYGYYFLKTYPNFTASLFCRKGITAKWSAGWFGAIYNQYSSQQVVTLGKHVFGDLVNVLWDLEPHHDIFSAIYAKISKLFRNYTGYNGFRVKRKPQVL